MNLSEWGSTEWMVVILNFVCLAFVAWIFVLQKRIAGLKEQLHGLGLEISALRKVREAAFEEPDDDEGPLFSPGLTEPVQDSNDDESEVKSDDTAGG